MSSNVQSTFNHSATDEHVDSLHCVAEKFSNTALGTFASISVRQSGAEIAV